ncbi:MAG: metallophosphoesterase, partial [bacterium]
LVGIDDEAIWDHKVHESDILKAQQTDLFTVFLKHRPTFGLGDDQYFDLQLSGHAHRGQIFPFNYVTGIEYPMQNGWTPFQKMKRTGCSRP